MAVIKPEVVSRIVTIFDATSRIWSACYITSNSGKPWYRFTCDARNEVYAVALVLANMRRVEEHVIAGSESCYIIDKFGLSDFDMLDKD